VALAGVFAAAVGPAYAAALRIDYTMSILGLRIGGASLAVELDEAGYAATFVGRVQGLARIFSDGRVEAMATGLLSARRLQPDAYRQQWAEEDDAETITMRFSGGRAAEIDAAPPRRRPERYKPVGEGDRRGVLDPLSGTLWPSPDGLSPLLCERTIPFFDGRRRFDLILTYSRMARFRMFAGDRARPALVCAVRYRAISGHRPGRASIEEMEANDELEVWMSLIKPLGIAAPVKVSALTRHGRLVIQAKRLQVDDDRQRTNAEERASQ
jgi:hypothetical protein